MGRLEHMTSTNASTSPGILSAESLQCILGQTSSTHNSGKTQWTPSEHAAATAAAHRKLSQSVSETLSPYDPRYAAVPSSSPLLLLLPAYAVSTPQRHYDKSTATADRAQCHKRSRSINALKRKRHSNTKLQPMATALSSPTRLASDTSSGRADCVHAPALPVNRARKDTALNKTKQQRVASSPANQLASARDRCSAAASLPLRPLKPPLPSTLADEIAWIRTHVPVLQLATAKCSLALRQQLFATTLVANVTRALVRLRWRDWRAVVAAHKREMQRRRCAAVALAERFCALATDLVRQRFCTWTSWMRDCRALEQFAASVTIQQFAKQQRSRRCAQQATRDQTALDLHNTLQALHAHACTIQRILQTCMHKRRCQHTLQAAQNIQQAVRVHQQEVHSQRLHSATRLIQHAYRQFESATHARFAAVAKRAQRTHCAQVIQRSWRCFAAWMHTDAPLQCVARIVELVEYDAAIAAIALIERRDFAAACKLQRAWRSYTQRQRVLTIAQQQQTSAASVLQRTFRRKRERAAVCTALQASAQPLYLQARSRSMRFRDRFCVPIAHSAAAAVQRCWQHYRVYDHCRSQCDTAATVVQCTWRRARRRAAWRVVVSDALQQHHRRAHAAQCIQRCAHVWLAHRNARASVSAIQLAAMVHAALCIQRCVRQRYERQRDAWRCVLVSVLQTQLSHYRKAVHRIATAWRAHSARKQALLASDALRLDGSINDGGRSDGSGVASLAELRELIVAQQTQTEREHAAAKCIQRMARRRIDRRNGKLLLRKYRIMMQRELRMRAQRRVIHDFLDEQARERTLWQQRHAAKIAAAASSAGSTATGAGFAGAQPDATAASVSDTVAADDGVQQFWSDEYERAYTYNARTGESVWL